MEVMCSDGGTPLSKNMACGINVTPSMALNMCESLYLIVLYLLKRELEDLEVNSQDWIGNIGG